jgi:hypothetical protein
LQVDRRVLEDMLMSFSVNETKGDITDTLMHYVPKLGLGVAWSDALNHIVFPWEHEDWDLRNKE